MTAESGALIGTALVVEPTAPVAGGRCIARHQGQVIFVRGALPGERVEVRITGSGRGGGFLWAEVTSVLEASPDRVEPPCDVAGVCGGCDWQHAALPAQRRLKADVIIDALRRNGGVESIGDVPLADAILVEALDDGNGLDWRTRMRFATDATGTASLRKFDSHDLVATPACPIAAPAIRDWISDAVLPPNTEVIAAASSTGELVVKTASGEKLTTGRGRVTEVVAGREFRVAAEGFWQVHPRAAETLTDAVLSYADPQPGETVADLYSGVGLFTAPIAERVGADGVVHAVEGDHDAVRNARRNLHQAPNVHIHHGSVQDWLTDHPDQLDLVVLDPPRVGAGADTVAAICSPIPRAVIYVACDPVALARDVRTFSEIGYNLKALRAFDLFPMTKHVEAVALFVRS